MKFEPTPEGFAKARAYLMEKGLYNNTAKRMDGYSLVFHANDVYEKKK